MSKINIVFWTQGGNTQMMAEAIADGVRDAGKEAEVVFVSSITPDALKDEPVFALGCPAMGAEVLEEAEMEPFVAEVEGFASGKKIALFGSYGWGDGEFRRTFWHLDFMWGLDGVAHENTGNGVKFDAELAVLDDTYLVGKIKAKAHPFVEYFKFLKQFEDENTVAKYTIPAPAQTFQQMIVPDNIANTRKFYPTNEELIQDIGKAYQDVIKQFYDAGCRNLQLDDCTWGAIVGDAAKQRYKALGISLEDVKNELLAVNNLALERNPEDMVITSHICRGNYHSTFFTSGPYDTVADYVFANENVDALFLEYDDERSGGFAPLAKVSENKKVVLGLITTKSPVLEDKEKVIARIHEAAKYVPLDRLCLSPQCGFASCEIGNKLTEEEQWAKLKLVKEIAEEVWS